MAYPNKGILLSNKNKLETLKATCNFRNEPQDNSSELKKTVKRKIRKCYLIYSNSRSVVALGMVGTFRRLGRKDYKCAQRNFCG